MYCDLLTDCTTTAGARMQQLQQESRDDVIASQSRRHVRRRADDDDSGDDVMTPSSAVTFKSPAAYVTTRIQLYATFSIYFKVSLRSTVRGHRIVLRMR